MADIQDEKQRKELYRLLLTDPATRSNTSKYSFKQWENKLLGDEENLARVADYAVKKSWALDQEDFLYKYAPEAVQAPPAPKAKAAPVAPVPIEEEEAYIPEPPPVVGSREYDAQLQMQYGGMKPTLGATFGGVPAAFETKAQKKQEQISPAFKAQKLAFEDVPIAEEQRRAQRQFAKSMKEQQQIEQQQPKGFFEDLGTQVKRGLAQGRAIQSVNMEQLRDAARGKNLEAIPYEQIAAANKAVKEFGQTQSDIDLATKEGIIKDAWDVVKALPGVTIESLASLGRSGIEEAIVGAGTGAAAGSVIPGLGTAAGGGLGATAGMVQAGRNMEYFGTLMQELEAKGVDITDPAKLKYGIATYGKDADKTAITRANTIAAVESALPVAGKAAGALAGRVSSKVAQKPLQAISKGLSYEPVAGPLGGATGELAAQIASGQEIDPQAIALEAGGEGAATVAAVAKAIKSRKKPSTEPSIAPEAEVIPVEEVQGPGYQIAYAKTREEIPQEYRGTIVEIERPTTRLGRFGPMERLFAYRVPTETIDITAPEAITEEDLAEEIPIEELPPVTEEAPADLMAAAERYEQAPAEEVAPATTGMFEGIEGPPMEEENFIVEPDSELSQRILDNGEQVVSRLDAEKRIGDGERLFGFNEQDDSLVELSLKNLDAFPVDTIIAVRPEVIEEAPAPVTEEVPAPAFQEEEVVSAAPVEEVAPEAPAVPKKAAKEMSLEELKAESKAFDEKVKAEKERLKRIAPTRQIIGGADIENLSEADAVRYSEVNDELARRTTPSQEEAKRRVAEKREQRRREQEPTAKKIDKKSVQASLEKAKEEYEKAKGAFDRKRLELDKTTKEDVKDIFGERKVEMKAKGLFEMPRISPKQREIAIQPFRDRMNKAKEEVNRLTKMLEEGEEAAKEITFEKEKEYEQVQGAGQKAREGKGAPKAERAIRPKAKPVRNAGKTPDAITARNITFYSDPFATSLQYLMDATYHPDLLESIFGGPSRTTKSGRKDISGERKARIQFLDKTSNIKSADRLGEYLAERYAEENNIDVKDAEQQHDFASIATDIISSYSSRNQMVRELLRLNEQQNDEFEFMYNPEDIYGEGYNEDIAKEIDNILDELPDSYWEGREITDEEFNNLFAEETESETKEGKKADGKEEKVTPTSKPQEAAVEIAKAFTDRFGIKVNLIDSKGLQDLLSKSENAKEFFFKVLDKIDVFETDNIQEAKNFITTVFQTVESAEDAKKAYRKLAIKYHPDKRGSEEVMKHLNDVNEKYQKGTLGRGAAQQERPSQATKEQRYREWAERMSRQYEADARAYAESSQMGDEQRAREAAKAQAEKEAREARAKAAQPTQKETKAEQPKPKPAQPTSKIKKGIIESLVEFFTKPFGAEKTTKGEVLTFETRSKYKQDAWNKRNSLKEENRKNELSRINENLKNYTSDRITTKQYRENEAAIRSEYANKNKAVDDWYNNTVAAIDKAYEKKIPFAYKQYVGDKVAGLYDPISLQAYVVLDNLDETTFVHEAFSHPFIEAVKERNNELYNNLLAESKNTQEIVDYVDENYGNAPQQVKDAEYIARAIDLDAKGKLKNKTLIEYVRQFWAEANKIFKDIFGGKGVAIENISPTTKVSDIVDFVLTSGEKLDLNKPSAPSFTSQQSSEAATAFDKAKTSKGFDKKYGKGSYKALSDITKNFDAIMDKVSDKIKQDCL